MMKMHQSTEKVLTVKNENALQLSVEKVNKYLQIKWSVCAIVFILVLFFFLTQNIHLIGFVTTSIFLALCAAVGILIRPKTKKEKSILTLTHLSVSSDLALVLMSIYFTGGFVNAWLFFPVLVIFAASYLFSLKTSLIYATFSFCSIVLLFILEYFKLIPHFDNYGLPQDFHLLYPTYWKDSLLGMFILYYASAYTSGYFTRIMRQSAARIQEKNVTLNQEMAKRIQVEKELREHQDHLEKLVKARTAELKIKNEELLKEMSERQHMEEELLKIQKLDSVGVLAGGIAHDFNNILTSILGNISVAIMHTTPQSEISQILTNAEKAALRAKDLTMQLLTFSKGGAPLRTSASITDLIKDSTNFILRGSNVKCEFSLPDDLWPVEIDEGQMSQVINNLIINADQAMPGGGNIEISATNVMIRPGDLIPLKKGKYIKVSIKDHGKGITKRNLTRIFDPYFTTKRSGSGLGLSVAYSIVKKHEGYITVTSEPGKGTTFYIYIPASREKIPVKRALKENLYVGKRNILVMDDEKSVRETLSTMLKKLGCEVVCVNDGAEAIIMYKQSKETGKPFDVVIMDLTIPGGMGGQETIKKLLEIDPEVKAIVSSGYSNDPIMSHYQAYGFSSVIAKPYRITELSKILRDVMMS
jgi:signal transduction histidine kinase/CheY-like chemotaxis protein